MAEQSKYKLSIITPCYNNGAFFVDYLKTINSIFLNEIEFIVVDDCSKDDSYEVLLNYRNSSSINMNVYETNENSGPGIARNLGVSKAKGNYITFLDSDDKLTDGFFKEILPILDNNYDSVIFDYNLVYSATSIRSSSMYASLPNGLIDTKTALVYTKGGTWCKVYKRNIIVDNNIEFNNQKIDEDLPFTKVALAHCNMIYFINKPLYQYVQHSKSLTHNSAFTDYKNNLNSFNYIKNRINNSFKVEVEGIYIVELLTAMVINRIFELNKKEWIKFVKETMLLYPNYRNNPYIDKLSIKRRVILKLVELRCYYLLKFLYKLK